MRNFGKISIKVKYDISIMVLAGYFNTNWRAIDIVIISTARSSIAFLELYVSFSQLALHCLARSNEQSHGDKISLERQD